MICKNTGGQGMRNEWRIEAIWRMRICSDIGRSPLSWCISPFGWFRSAPSHAYICIIPHFHFSEICRLVRVRRTSSSVLPRVVVRATRQDRLCRYGRCLMCPRCGSNFWFYDFVIFKHHRFQFFTLMLPSCFLKMWRGSMGIKINMKRVALGGIWCILKCSEKYEVIGSFVPIWVVPRYTRMTLKSG